VNGLEDAAISRGKERVLKKTITYEDFDGNSVSEDHFFHLSKAELVELEMSHQGGLSEALKRIVAAEDGKSIIAEFKNIILGAYGKRSDDGKRFVKNQQIRDEFESTEAYSTLFMELVTNTDAAIEFINGVIPAGMTEEAARLAQTENAPIIAAVPTPEPRVLTRKDLQEMSSEEIQNLGPKLQSGEVRLSE
jgi:hypothetical protein